MKKRKVAKKHRAGTRRSKPKARKSSAKKRSAKTRTTKKRSAAKAKSRKVKKARPKRPAKARKKPRPSKARRARKRAPSKKAKPRKKAPKARLKKAKKARRPAVKKAKAKKKVLKPKKKAPKARLKKVPKRAKPAKAAAKPKARVAKPKRAKTRALLSREERKKKRAKDLAKLVAMRKKKQAVAPARKSKGAVAQEPGHELQAAERTAKKRAPAKRVSHIRKGELEKLRSELLEERERLIQELKALDEITHTDGEGGGNHQIPGYSTHLAEYATDNQTIETALDLRRIQHERLTQVEEALQRLERGDYGICESCGKAIGINRLLAKPFARFCVPCRRAYEAQRL